MNRDEFDASKSAQQDLSDRLAALERDFNDSGIKAKTVGYAFERRESALDRDETLNLTGRSRNGPEARYLSSPPTVSSQTYICEEPIVHSIYTASLFFTHAPIIPAVSSCFVVRTRGEKQQRSHLPT